VRPAAPRAVAALLAVALSGCYTIRYERRGASPEAGAPRAVWTHGILGGTIPASLPVDLARACPDGFASVENEVTAGNALGQLLTSFGVLLALHAPVWEPTTVRVVCARPAAQAGKRKKVVVLPLAALGGVTEERARLLGDALAGELRRRPGVSVLTQSDVAALLGVERTRQMLGCAESGCMAEIGGALGADRVIHGSIGRVGSSMVVNLSALDAKRGAPVASVSERLRAGDDEAFLDALPAIADAVLADPAPR
jgi:TolB-like protein